MRIPSIAFALSILSPAAAWAQTPYPAAPPGNGGAMGDRVITRDQFVQHAAQMAGRRFDMIDVNHTGTVTMSQVRAFRAAHQGQVGGRPSGGPAQPPIDQ